MAAKTYLAHEMGSNSEKECGMAASMAHERGIERGHGMAK